MQWRNTRHCCLMQSQPNKSVPTSPPWQQPLLFRTVKPTSRILGLETIEASKARQQLAMLQNLKAHTKFMWTTRPCWCEWLAQSVVNYPSPLTLYSYFLFVIFPSKHPSLRQAVINIYISTLNSTHQRRQKAFWPQTSLEQALKKTLPDQH